MSKFYKGAVSSSESSSESDHEERIVNQRVTVPDFAIPSDSEDEAPKRVVRANKDKRFGELKDIIRSAKNSRNVKDMVKLLQCFENLAKAFEKTKPVLMREGLQIPRFFIRHVAELDDFIKNIWNDKDARGTLSKSNGKSLSTLRQKVIKFSKMIENELEKYRESPDPFGYSSGEEKVGDKSDSENEDITPANKAPVKADVTVSSDSDSDDESDWGSDTMSDTSSDSDIDFEGKQKEELRKFFLKKEFKEGGDKEKTVKRDRRIRQEKKREEGDSDDDDEKWEKVMSKEESKKQIFDSKTEITPAVVLKKLEELVAQRGRMATDRKEYLRILQELQKISEEKKFPISLTSKIIFVIISSLFELHSRLVDCMEFDTWLRALKCLDSLVDILVKNPKFEMKVSMDEEDENIIDDTMPLRLHGSVILSVHRLDNELTKIFQNADYLSTEYIEKLKGEQEFCNLLEKVLSYVESKKDTGIFMDDELIQVYMMRIEHMYYKFDYEHKEDGEKLMDLLCKKVYCFESAKRERQRALLCQIYHHALHDRWQKAKDMLLMSHLQSLVDHSDPATQILYNRTICQVGLCAFRHGSIKEAYHGLSDIQNTSRAKEYLAQGILSRTEKTAEQERLERSRQVPFHMHINLELMECVFLICCMLLDVPSMALGEYDVRKRTLCRSFLSQLKFSERSALIGPPENSREHVVAAARAMLTGDWKKCKDYLINEKMNVKVWNLFRNSEQVKSMVISRIQEESLRTYLLMYTTVYETISLGMLVNLFELSKEKVHSIISKMIIQEELIASLDQPSDCLIMHRVEPSRIQLLSYALAERVSQLCDTTDQIIEPRQMKSNYNGKRIFDSNRTNAGDNRQNNYENRKQANYGGQDNKSRNWNKGNSRAPRTSHMH
ncbi:Eukaryotic translation initiation factor 3 subunit C [Strongyloides ratti]|uniref:Eukaryotic translation initiation factor 3 subunit C n=1 Tax=Strongyloides ratti TaxID=34506 RepID=A0A090LAN3_STRRB|nr:Eukaryotic translation initiation factor 3 subunit C [Strongyloides ratti]CEF66807.1 Eukaryotic translation initiation factor 3 subunit C [Strongyloides ratti]